MNEKIIEQINNSLIEEFELAPEAMKPDAHLFKDLEMDSLDIVDLVVVLENTFQFKIREESAIREIRTLGDIHNFVIEKHRQVADTES